MPRLWVRLVACLILAAFVAANGPFTVRFCVIACPCGDSHSCSSPSTRPHAGCKHCQAEQAKQHDAEEAAGGAAVSSEPSAPCPRPSMPFGCPGGCAYCSVAKVLAAD